MAAAGGGRLFSPSPSAPAVVDGRYQVIRTLGSGAMGSVFLVKHVRLKKAFALKMVNPYLASLPEYVSRFEREADACSRLKHPNCISVTDFGQAEDGSLYLVMEYADGTPLSSIIDKGPLPIPEAIEFTRQILLGLGHAHREGLIHRDIKLENIVKTRGDDGHVNLKILDFGMAKNRPKETSTPQITRDGMVMGTPQYMSPEQIRDDKIDARTDLYATGVTLFRMITGKPLFDTNNPLDVFKAKLKERPPSLSEVAGKPYPEALEAFIAKALEYDPENRYDNAEDMLQALESVEAEIVTGGGTVSQLRRLQRRVGAAFIAGWQGVIRSARNGVTGLKRDTVTWYQCRSQDVLPSWRARLRGLVTTREGRIFTIRVAAVTIIVSVLTTAFWGSDATEADSAARTTAVAAPPATTSVSPPTGSVSPPSGSVSPASGSGATPSTNQATAVSPAGVDAPKSVSSINDELTAVEKLLRENKCIKAAARMRDLKDATGARGSYLMGRTQACLGHPDEALAYFGKAIAADAAWRDTPALLKDVKKLSGMPKGRDAALAFMVDAIGKPAAPVIIDLAGSSPQRQVRQTARKHAETLGVLDKVNLERSYAMDLNQARTCAEKREAVEHLGELNTPKARQILIRARDAQVKEGWFKKRYRHECVRRNIIKALAKR